MMTSELPLEPLVTMTPVVLGRDVVRLASRHMFLVHVKGQAPVHDIFFPKYPKQPSDSSDSTQRQLPEVSAMLDEITWFDFSRYSVLYVAQAICQLCDSFGIHSMLDEDIINEQLSSIHDSSHWKKIGFALYTALFCEIVKDEKTKLPFKSYIDDDSRLWARRLCDRVHDTQWVQSQFTMQVDESSTAELNTSHINAFFVKLHLLVPMSVLPAFNALSKVLSDVSLDLATTNYLGEPLQWSLIREDVLAAINMASYPTNVSSWSLTTHPIEHYYGIRVSEFILMDCHELGLWTGEYPDNRRVSRFRDRCLIM